MNRIAIIEDNPTEANRLKKMLERYSEENKVTMGIICFNNAFDFLNEYKANYDIIFMDIDMPLINGMEAAAKLREKDRTTILIFVTNMANMAEKGYEVEAFDFIVKPVSYENISMKLKRVFRKLIQKNEKKVIILSKGNRICLPISAIYYIEVKNRQLIYNTAMGIFTVYGTMTNIRDEMQEWGFAQCNNCYLVNLHHVKNINDSQVLVQGDKLQMSQSKKKTFIEALNRYIGSYL